MSICPAFDFFVLWPALIQMPWYLVPQTFTMSKKDPCDRVSAFLRFREIGCYPDLYPEPMHVFFKGRRIGGEEGVNPAMVD